MMRILETVLFEYIFGYILQGFAFILGIYAFNRKKIEAKKFMIASIIFIVISYITRLLPINFGIHTILDLICIFLLGILFLKMSALVTIRSLLIITVILLITEMLNVFIMTNILGQEKFNSFMNDNIMKYIVGLPAAIIFAVLILISYMILVKKSLKNGKTSS